MIQQAYETNVKPITTQKQTDIIYAKLDNLNELKKGIDGTLYQLEETLFAGYPEEIHETADKMAIGFFEYTNKKLDILTNEYQKILNRLVKLTENV